jgi:hypothetical protein
LAQLEACLVHIVDILDFSVIIAPETLEFLQKALNNGQVRGRKSLNIYSPSFARFELWMASYKERNIMLSKRLTVPFILQDFGDDSSNSRVIRA